MPTYPNSFSSYNVQSRATTSNLLARSSTLSITKLLILGVGNLPLLRAAPTYLSPFIKTTTENQPSTAQGPTLWVYLSVAVVLVLLGGAFAGLTIALMGQVWCSKDYITFTMGSYPDLPSIRMRSICRSLRNLERAMKKSTLPKC